MSVNGIMPYRRRLQSKQYPRQNPVMDVMLSAGAAKAAQVLRDAMGGKKKKKKSLPKPAQQLHMTPATKKPVQYRRKNTIVTTTTTNKKDQGTGPYNQLEYHSYKSKLGKYTLKKQLKTAVDHAIFRFTNLARFGAGGAGSRYLIHSADTRTINSIIVNGYTLPLYLFELNSVPNMVGGTFTSPNPLLRCFKTSTGSYYFDAVQGYTPTGATANSWQVEVSDNAANNALSVPHDDSIHKWVSIQMELWGMKNFPTGYVIQLVQLNEDVVPTEGTEVTGAAIEFYDMLMKKFSYNPLATLNTSYSKKMRVLKEYKFMIDPTSTTESDSRPHCKVLKLFYELNRKCNFDWYNTGTVGTTAAAFESAAWNQDVAQGNNMRVHPNARLYLMIRATNFELQALTTDCTSTNTPSFTIDVRSKHMFNQ